jgi:hypothetical protein
MLNLQDALIISITYPAWIPLVSILTSPKAKNLHYQKIIYPNTAAGICTIMHIPAAIMSE